MAALAAGRLPGTQGRQCQAAISAQVLALRKCLTICQGMMYPTLSAFVSFEKATPATFPSCRLAKAGPPLLPAGKRSPQQASPCSLHSSWCWDTSLSLQHAMQLTAHSAWQQQQAREDTGSILYMQLTALGCRHLLSPEDA